MALMQLTVVPMGTAGTGVSAFVADFMRALERRGVPHALNDMACVIEGETATLLDIARELHELSFAKGAPRVITHLTIDERRDKTVSLGDKVKAVEARLR